MIQSGDTPPRPFDVALSLACHARAMGFRRIFVRKTRNPRSDSHYLWFCAGMTRHCLRVSDHRLTNLVADFDLADLKDIAPAIAWMRRLRGSVGSGA